MKDKKVTAHYILSEPGDGTRYEFIMMADPDDLDYIIIAQGSGGANFKTYRYREDSIKKFMDNHPLLLTWDREEYEKKVQGDDSIGTDPLVYYVVDHSRCNPWTAISALVCAYKIYLKE